MVFCFSLCSHVLCLYNNGAPCRFFIGIIILDEQLNALNSTGAIAITIGGLLVSYAKQLRRQQQHHHCNANAVDDAANKSIDAQCEEKSAEKSADVQTERLTLPISASVSTFNARIEAGEVELEGVNKGNRSHTMSS